MHDGSLRYPVIRDLAETFPVQSGAKTAPTEPPGTNETVPRCRKGSERHRSRGHHNNSDGLERRYEGIGPWRGSDGAGALFQLLA